MKEHKLLNLFVITTIIIMVIVIIFDTLFLKRSCIDKGIITDIVRVEYRTAYAEIDHDKIVSINQGIFKTGDDYCVEYENNIIYPWDNIK